MTAKCGDMFASHMASKNVASIKCSMSLGQLLWELEEIDCTFLGFIAFHAAPSEVTGDLSNISKCACVH